MKFTSIARRQVSIALTPAFDYENHAHGRVAPRYLHPRVAIGVSEIMHASPSKWRSMPSAARCRPSPGQFVRFIARAMGAPATSRNAAIRKRAIFHFQPYQPRHNQLAVEYRGRPALISVKPICETARLRRYQMRKFGIKALNIDIIAAPIEAYDMPR